MSKYVQRLKNLPSKPVLEARIKRFESKIAQINLKIARLTWMGDMTEAEKLNNLIKYENQKIAKTLAQLKSIRSLRVMVGREKNGR